MSDGVVAVAPDQQGCRIAPADDVAVELRKTCARVDVVDDDARVTLALGVFKAPEFFAGFVGDGDGFAFAGNEVARGARGFGQSLCVGEDVIGERCRRRELDI